MSGPEKLDWDRLREDVAAVHGAADHDAVTRRRARARFIDAASRRSRRARSLRWRWRWSIPVVCGLAITSFVVWLTYPRSHPLTFETRAGQPGLVGDWIATSAQETLPLRFSDGSLLDLAPSSQARVTEASAVGATVDIASGSANVRVVRRRATRWRMTAGPFSVLVVGTRFRLSWRAEDQVLELEMQEGAVTVFGPSLRPEGRRLMASEFLRVARSDWSADRAGQSPSAAQAGPAGPATSPDAPGAPGKRKVESGLTDKPALIRSGEGRPSWRKLALAERYADALAAAESQNIDSIYRRASAADLLLLANSAYFAGATERADQAFASVRSRFPGSAAAAVAAFSLGRSAYDRQHKFSDAIRWFAAYLKESPDGALSREAAGRLIEAQHAAGNDERAREAASRYLSRYPSGPHASLARSLVRD
ncbi:MAG TPA: FecR domain-containing protein [Polyangia bacterium]|nr:FecR domain-containing protein [Polyangia bacterium]